MLRHQHRADRPNRSLRRGPQGSVEGHFVAPVGTVIKDRATPNGLAEHLL